MPTDIPGAPKLAKGRALFEDLGCIGCHKLHGTGGVIGPELDGVGARRSPEWLGKHFHNPAEVTPGSAMPPIKVSDDEIEDLTMYMLSLTGERLSAYFVSMKTLPGPEAGRALFEEKGCIGCHSLGGKGGTVGPALDEVGKRRNPDWIVAHFRNPQAVTPGSVMPQFDFTDEQIRALTEFLLTKTDPNVVGYLKIPALMTPVERGKAVFRKYGCAGCHGLEGKGGVPNPNAKTAQQVPGLAVRCRQLHEGGTAKADPQRPARDSRDGSEASAAASLHAALAGQDRRGRAQRPCRVLDEPHAQGREDRVLDSEPVGLAFACGAGLAVAHPTKCDTDYSCSSHRSIRAENPQ